MISLHIGIDDTDSPDGMCTTFIGAKIYHALIERGIGRPLDLPYLVRLNPNIPFKTRGNGAVSLHFTLDKGSVEEVVRLVSEHIERYAETHGKTEPAAIVVTNLLDSMKRVYRKALHDVVPLKYVEEVIESAGKTPLYIIGGGRGLVGAVAAVGAYPLEEYTYELLLYRDPSRRKKRPYDEDIVLEIDRQTRPQTFANMDYERRRPLIYPHGPDPVIAGIRSFKLEILKKLARRLARTWEVDCWEIFKTNQGLGVHLRNYVSIGKVRPYQSICLLGRVATRPRVIRGGHLFFHIEYEGHSILCAVFKETGFLNRVARLLRVGDLVEIYGGVSPPSKSQEITVNVEMIRVVKPRRALVVERERCPRCGGTFTSMGRGKGYKCKKCGFRTPKIRYTRKTIPPLLEPGLYMQSPRAYRHLSLAKRYLDYCGALPEALRPLLP